MKVWAKFCFLRGSSITRLLSFSAPGGWLSWSPSDTDEQLPECRGVPARILQIEAVSSRGEILLQQAPIPFFLAHQEMAYFCPPHSLCVCVFVSVSLSLPLSFFF